MATLAIQLVGEAGLNAAFAAAAAGGDVFANSVDERTYLHIKNGGGGSITATATAQSTTATVRGFGSLSRGNIAVAIPAGEERLIGPFAEAFNNSSGQVAVTYSGVTSVTVAAIKLPRLS